MTNSLIDNRYLKRFSSLNLPAELSGQTDSGLLILSSDRLVVGVNTQYQQFHKFFALHELHTGEILGESSLASYPCNFEEKLISVFRGQSEKLSFQSIPVNQNSPSFVITISQLSDEAINFRGATVRVDVTHNSSLERQGENLYKYLVDTSSSVYQLADAAFIFTYISKAVEDILGYSPEELTGKSAIELVHPDDKETVRDWLINVRKQQNKLLSQEYRVKNKKGEYVWIENSARNMLSDGGIKSVVMSFRNIQAKKVADHALIQAEQRLSLLLNNTEESFIILNSRLRIITYNKAAQDRSPFFYHRELQSGLSVLDLISKDEIHSYIHVFEEVFKGKEISTESRFVDVSGVEHIYNHTFRPLFDSQKDIFGVFITSTEITERRKLTEELALHSERLKTAQKIAKLGYFEYDLQTKSVFCSEQFYQILEMSNVINSWPELLSVESLVHPDDQEVLKAEIEKSVLHAEDFSVEFRLRTAGTDEKVILAMGGFEVSETGKNTKFRVTLQDITDSKMALLAIQTLESKFKSLFDNSIDGVILSTHTGSIISANPSVCKMLGYTVEEITSKTCCDIIDIKSTSVSEMIQIQEAYGSFVGELYLKHKNGHYVAVEVSSISMKDGNDKSYLSTIIRDITEKKKSESEQKALTEELLKNNQDLQQFSFITSHNLRAPVANLISLLSLYNKQNPADEFNQLLIEKFEEATQQLNQTLNDLINVLVVKSNNNVEKETISLTEIFVLVKKNVESLLSEKQGVIEADFSAVDELRYNRIHLESIFLNMITNAIRYSSPKRKPEIKIRSHKQDDWIVIDFTDNGLGMDIERYGDRLFGLYQRFHGNKEGKGLGLYMTKSQVIAMGGKIEVDSELDKGTTFTIFFKS